MIVVTIIYILEAYRIPYLIIGHELLCLLRAHIPDVRYHKNIALCEADHHISRLGCIVLDNSVTYHKPLRDTAPVALRIVFTAVYTCGVVSPLYKLLKSLAILALIKIRPRIDCRQLHPRWVINYKQLRKK